MVKKKVTLQNFVKHGYKPVTPWAIDQIAYLEDIIRSLIIYIKGAKKLDPDKVTDKLMGTLKEIKEAKVIKLKLIRLEETPEGAIGVLMFEEQVFCLTLEPDARDTVRFQIPVGIHPMRQFKGTEETKWHDTLEVVVKGHTVLLFHSGNVEKHSVGCILLGSEASKLRGQRAVLNSGNTFTRFKEEVVPTIQDGDEIEIINFINGSM